MPSQGFGMGAMGPVTNLPKVVNRKAAIAEEDIEDNDNPSYASGVKTNYLKFYGFVKVPENYGPKKCDSLKARLVAAIEEAEKLMNDKISSEHHPDMEGVEIDIEVVE